jgi:hypothetical protein
MHGSEEGGGIAKIQVIIDNRGPAESGLKNLKITLQQAAGNLPRKEF